MFRFDGSIERIKCVTTRKDFEVMCNEAVLSRAWPMLKDRLGKSNRDPSTIPSREYVIILQ